MEHAALNRQELDESLDITGSLYKALKAVCDAEYNYVNKEYRRIQIICHGIEGNAPKINNYPSEYYLPTLLMMIIERLPLSPGTHHITSTRLEGIKQLIKTYLQYSKCVEEHKKELISGQKKLGSKKVRNIKSR